MKLHLRATGYHVPNRISQCYLLTVFTLATIVAEFGDYIRQCGHGFAFFATPPQL